MAHTQEPCSTIKEILILKQKTVVLYFKIKTFVECIGPDRDNIKFIF